MSFQDSYERAIDRKRQCEADIKIFAYMGNKVAARVARAEWQQLHTHLARLAEKGDV